MNASKAARPMVVVLAVTLLLAATGWGAVDAADLVVLAQTFGLAGDFGYADGDFGGDGMVDAGDLARLAGNFGVIVHPVPEPMSLGLLALGGVGLLRRRR
jgi:hypothetical protein